MMKLILFFLMHLMLTSGYAAEVRLNKSLNEQVVFVKNNYGLFSTELETTIFKPEGNGPFPLIVINHGKESGSPHFQARSRSIVASREFVRRGYVVMLPMRGGFSQSTGNYIAGGCNTTGNGMAQAEDVRAALDHGVTLPFVDRQRMIVIGQSHGGITTMAFGTTPYPGVLGLINFAGGLKLDTCTGWESSLAAAFGNYGEKNRFPTLWFYGDNDSYWSKETIANMYSSYTASGGKARLVSFGTFKGDAHRLFGDRDGLAIWWPEVEKFLIELGLPTQPIPQERVSDDPVLKRLQEAGQASFLSTNCRKLYQTLIDADYPRAFAISDIGRCGYAYGGENPQQRALVNCRGKTEAICSLYLVDDEIVGTP